MFNYDDTERAKKRIKIVFLIYTVLVFIPIVYGMLTSTFISLLLIICFLPIFLLLYLVLSKSPVVEKTITEFIKLFSPDEVAVYSSGLLTCVTMRKFDYFVLVRDFRFRNVYICKGVEKK